MLITEIYKILYNKPHLYIALKITSDKLYMYFNCTNYMSMEQLQGCKFTGMDRGKAVRLWRYYQACNIQLRR